MASGNDMKAHEATFSGFIGLLKVASIVVVALTILVVWLIAS